MGAHNFNDLVSHVGHDIVCVTYNSENKPVNVAIECEECNEVLLDFDIEEHYNQARVEIEDDYVAIFDCNGEIVRWIDDEWMDDPTIIPSIATAIALSLTKGPEELRNILK